MTSNLQQIINNLTLKIRGTFKTAIKYTNKAHKIVKSIIDCVLL